MISPCDVFTTSSRSIYLVFFTFLIIHTTDVFFGTA